MDEFRRPSRVRFKDTADEAQSVPECGSSRGIPSQESATPVRAGPPAWAG